MFIREMSKSDCLNALAATRLGRLACAHKNQPYIVPIYFVYHEPYLCGFTTPGQKVEWMRDNPLVCVEVDEVKDCEHWTSVVVFGRYEERQDPDEWEHLSLDAFKRLNEHAEWWEPCCASSAHRDPAQPFTPIFFRIHINRITGRRASSGPCSRKESSPAFSARDSQGWLRRVLHAVSLRSMRMWDRIRYPDPSGRPSGKTHV